MEVVADRSTVTRLSRGVDVHKTLSTASVEKSLRVLEGYRERIDALGATLSCIYLEHNPLAKEYDYRQRVAALFPAVTQIDATMVRRG